jgi:ABC-type phosphate/phosphonate transport system ATPase subunit
MELIRAFNESLGMTVVTVTHERALAEKYARRMISMADGRLLADKVNETASERIRV